MRMHAVACILVVDCWFEPSQVDSVFADAVADEAAEEARRGRAAVERSQRRHKSRRDSDADRRIRLPQ